MFYNNTLTNSTWENLVNFSQVGPLGQAPQMCLQTPYVLQLYERYEIFFAICAFCLLVLTGIAILEYLHNHSVIVKNDEV